MNKRNKKGKSFIKPNENKINKGSEELFINLEDSDSEAENKNKISKTISSKKKKVFLNNIGEKKGNKKLLGNKHKPILEQDIQGNISEFNLNENKYKKQKKSNDKNKSISNISNNNNYCQNPLPNIQNKNENSHKSNNNIIIKKEKYEDENIFEFPYEFTERIIEAFTCGYCGGIYIRPYIINEIRCEHMFCLRCIMKMLDNKLIGECFKCKTQFSSINIKYCETTDFFVNIFFPQIPIIVEGYQNDFKKFFEVENEKYSEYKKEEGKKILICELKPFKENVPSHNRLPPIVQKYNKFMLNIKSENDNIISIVKKEIIKRLNLKLKEEELEIRIQGIEVTQLKTFKLMKNYLPSNLEVIFYYCKKGK